MSLAAEAEKRRYFGPEILIPSAISAAQDGIERKYDAHEARVLHPSRKKMICQLFHILRALVASGICRFPVYFAAREPTPRQLMTSHWGQAPCLVFIQARAAQFI